jgi:hypothetical protein
VRSEWSEEVLETQGRSSRFRELGQHVGGAKGLGPLWGREDGDHMGFVPGRWETVSCAALPYSVLTQTMHFYDIATHLLRMDCTKVHFLSSGDATLGGCQATHGVARISQLSLQPRGGA